MFRNSTVILIVKVASVRMRSYESKGAMTTAISTVTQLSESSRAVTMVDGLPHAASNLDA